MNMIACINFPILLFYNIINFKNSIESAKYLIYIKTKNKDFIINYWYII